jgi:hypothetical protein
MNRKMRRTFALGLALILAGALEREAAGQGGVDLAKVDRSIGKEPKYQSKSPRYCLLVTGKEAKSRVWLVLDDAVLYVDRNGNGDLTESGEQVKWTKVLLTGLQPPGTKEPDARNYTCELADKATVHLLTINGDYFQVDFTSSDGKRSFAAHHDAQGALQFAAKPQAAPLIHFDGPLMLKLATQTLQLGKEPGKLSFVIGTPGLGQGTFASLSIQCPPKDLHPVAEIEFPPAQPGGKPVVGKFELDQRC